MSNNNDKPLLNKAVEDKSNAKKKPILLSPERYEKILTNANQSNEQSILKNTKDEMKYREYLKKGSEDMIAAIQKYLPLTPEQKMLVTKKELERKAKQSEKMFQQSEETENKERREQLAKAQQMIEKAKPGPRELRGAAVQSEVLRVRNVQRNINKEFENAAKKQETMDQQLRELEVLSFIRAEQARMLDHQKRAINYKKELEQQTINQNTNKRIQQRKLSDEQRLVQTAMNHEINLQIEMERKIMENKRALQRKAAVEAMKMAEQRRRREFITNEVEDRRCFMHNMAKDKLGALKDVQLEQVRKKAIEAKAQVISTQAAREKSLKAERMRRDISHMELKFTAEEQKKIRMDRAAKQARIETHLREMEFEKEAKRRAEQQMLFEKVNCKNNIDVGTRFNEFTMQHRVRQVQMLRAQLNAQIEEKKRAEQAKRQEMLADKDNKDNIQDDKFFFNYAHNQIEDAKKKGRPLLPFIKAVNQYKRDNNIKGEVIKPNHLMSPPSIGAQKFDNNKIGCVLKTSVAIKNWPFIKNVKKNILANILRAPEKINRFGYGLKEQTILMTPQSRKRYTIEELKKLNQYTAQRNLQPEPKN